MSLTTKPIVNVYENLPTGMTVREFKNAMNEIIISPSAVAQSRRGEFDARRELNYIANHIVAPKTKGQGTTLGKMAVSIKKYVESLAAKH